LRLLPARHVTGLAELKSELAKVGASATTGIMKENTAIFSASKVRRP